MLINKPLISIIILNFNGKELLKESLESLKKQKTDNFEVIIVDNGSTDGSMDFIHRNYKEFTLLESKINSFAYGNNLGIKKSTGDFILLLNNDVEVDQLFIYEIILALKDADQNIGMWATKILNYDEREIFDNTGLLLYPDGLSRGRGRLEKDVGQYDEISNAFIPSGCAGVYRRKMLDEIGLLDEDFGFYLEDSDLGFRGRLAGWNCGFIPKAKIYHMYSMTAGKYSSRKAFYVERNRIWFVVKLLPLKLVIASVFYTFLRYFYQLWGAVSKQGATSKYVRNLPLYTIAFVLLRSWASALFGIPKFIKKRFKVKKKVSNKEIYMWYKQYKISVQELSLKD